MPKVTGTLKEQLRFTPPALKALCLSCPFVCVNEQGRALSGANCWEPWTNTAPTVLRIIIVSKKLKALVPAGTALARGWAHSTQWPPASGSWQLPHAHLSPWHGAPLKLVAPPPALGHE